MTTDKHDRLHGRKTLKPDIYEELEKDAVKKNIDIVELFDSFGVKLEKKGRNHSGCCPFHDDTTPSLSVDRDKGLFNCFGCGEAGDVVTLVEKMKGLDFRDAMAWLRSFNGNGHRETKKSDPAAAEVETGVSLHAVAAHYASCPAKNKDAVAYLEGRGLGNVGVQNRFALGYCDGSLSDKLSVTQKNALTSKGVFYESGAEALSGCITMPLYDEHGEVVGFYGRSIDPGTMPHHRYLKGPHKGILNRKAAAVYRDEIILTESVIDGLSLISLGFDNVIPCYGTNGFTREHERLFRDERVVRVVIAFDADDAGKNGAEKLRARLLSLDVQVKIISPAHTKDWNEALIQGIVTKEKVEALISAAELAAPAKPASPCEVVNDKSGCQFVFGDVTYRLLNGKDRTAIHQRLKLRATYQGKNHFDSVDLYVARSRMNCAQNLSMSMGIDSGRIERDLVAILERLESEREEAARREATPHLVTDEERSLGMELLTDPDLCTRVVTDMSALGYVGEDTNKLLVYLAATSRIMDDPLSFIVLSESAAGKSFLTETVTRLMPPEGVQVSSSNSDQAFQYMDDEALLHKFLVMGEAQHNEIIDHQVREMLSARQLTRLVTMKDPKTGELKTQEVRKKVVVALALTSTNYNLNAENLSRCFLLNTDESKEQTQRIHEAQKRKYTLERFREKEELIPAIIARHHAAQRILERRVIVNPFAGRIRFPDTLLRARRDHERFIDLIAAVSFLRQYQKEVKTAGATEYIECDEIDMKVALSIMREILPATLTNFPKSAMAMYDELRNTVREKARKEGVRPEDVSVTQRELRDATGFHYQFVRRNLRILKEYEFIRELGPKHRGSTPVYQLYRDEDIAVLRLSLWIGDA